MKHQSPLVRMGIPFLEWHPAVVYSLLVLIGQLLVSLPLVWTVSRLNLPASHNGWTYVLLVAYGLGVSAIAIYGVRKTRARYERQLEVLKIEELQQFLERPESHKLLLGSYQGAYSVGISRDPAHGKVLVIHLRIEGDDRMDIPSTVDVNSEQVPVLVSTGFAPPVAL